MAYREISTEEVMRLIPQARAGDREAWGRLAWLYDPFIAKVARWYDQREADTYDDAYQGGQLGLKSAIDDYRLGHGASFSTFATGRIRTGAQMEVNKQREGGRAKNIQVMSWDEPVDIPGDGPPAALREPQLASQEPDAEQVCARGRFIARMQDVAHGVTQTENERMLMDHRILAEEPLTLHEMAQLIGYSHEYVRLLENKVMSRLSVVLLGEEW